MDEWIEWTIVFPSLLLSFFFTTELLECIPMKKRCLPSSSIPEKIIHCHARGKFAHPDAIRSMFILCKGRHYAACHCMCPSHKHFNVTAQRCVISEPNLKDLVTHGKPDSSTLFPSWQPTDESLPWLNHATSQEHLGNGWRNNPSSVDQDHERVVVDLNMTAEIIDDEDVIPPWAIALIVLCLAIFAVLGILILY